MIDLLVVSHDTKTLLGRLLGTLQKDDDGETWQLYITDSGSGDGTPEYLTKTLAPASYFRIKSAWCTENVGYAAACNYMAKESNSDIIGFLNADVWLTTADVRAIQECFDTYPDMAIMGPKQRNERNFIVHAGIIGTNKKPQIRGWHEHDPLDRLYKDRLECVSVSGSAYFIRRSVWNDLADCDVYEHFLTRDLGMEDVPGAFLPTQHYYEETWCSYHARTHGHKVMYDGSVSIGHTWHASSQIGGGADRNMSLSKELFRRACASHGIECD
jgi:glycosyltransferase involved in cell wall biosynthesis